MSTDHKLLPLEKKFESRRPVVLLILDGYGIPVEKANKAGNAISMAHPENIDNFIKAAQAKGLYTTLYAHGTHVGLPADDDMGNSEVGHNAFGAGQVVAQGARLVNHAIESGNMFASDGWKQTVGSAIKNNKAIHLFGLLSNGGVHSHIDQLFKMIDQCVEEGAKKIFVHPLLDGRDVAPTSALIYIDQLEEKLKEVRSKGIHAMIASGAGRMDSTMDRYKSDWSMVRRGFDHIVLGVVSADKITSEYSGYFTTSTEAISLARSLYPEKQDQYNPPWVIVDPETKKPVGKVEKGDAIINFNYRGDRAIEISMVFDDGMKEDFGYIKFTEEERELIAGINYAGMLEYDTDAHIPRKSLLPPPTINNVMGEYLTATGKTIYAIAETHKYGHVTFFWNGNRSGYINANLEKYEEIKSEPNSMIESHPEMKAEEVTELLVENILSNKYDHLRCNLANPDMVGHTGSIPAVERAIKCVDKCVKKIADAVEKVGGVLLVTADHGNAEEMLDKDNKPKTSHTCGKVPFFIIDNHYNNEYVINTEGFEHPAGISNVAATVMNLMGYKAPEFYRPSLVKFN